MSPLITIIVPVYNREEYVGACLDSLEEQTYKNIEIIAVDNESTDKSYSVLESFKKSSEREVIISEAKNVFPNTYEECVKEGASLMSGEFFTIMGSDDLVSKHYIDNNIKYLASLRKAEEKVLAWQSPIRGIDASSHLNGRDVGHTYKTLEEFKAKLLTHSPVCTPSVFLRKDIEKNNIIDRESETYGGAGDYHGWCSLADQKIFIYPCSEFTGYYYRWHEKQATWNVHKEPQDYDKMISEKWSKKWKI